LSLDLLPICRAAPPSIRFNFVLPEIQLRPQIHEITLFKLSFEITSNSLKLAKDWVRNFHSLHENLHRCQLEYFHLPEPFRARKR
jgi:hypothetical protein